jgi:hypothetical protein
MFVIHFIYFTSSVYYLLSRFIVVIVVHYSMQVELVIIRLVISSQQNIHTFC